MKAQDFYQEMSIERHDSNLYTLSYSYSPSLYKINKSEILNKVKTQFFKNFKDKVNMNTYYVFKIEEYEEDENPLTGIKRLVYTIEVKLADTGHVVTYTYDELADKVFYKKRNFWQRLKLAFKYIFKRTL